MNPHVSEADLLETCYTGPDPSSAIVSHLASCGECSARFERLARKLRAAATGAEPPEEFWERQRAAILRRVAAVPRRSASGRTIRVAAAASLMIAFGGILTWRQLDRTPPQSPVPSTIAAVAKAVPSETSEATAPSDPWHSEALEDFQSIVAWESWMQNGSPTGDQPR